jgi:hypothetical protein
VSLEWFIIAKSGDEPREAYCLGSGPWSRSCLAADLPERMDPAIRERLRVMRDDLKANRRSFAFHIMQVWNLGYVEEQEHEGGWMTTVGAEIWDFCARHRWNVELEADCNDMPPMRVVGSRYTEDCEALARGEQPYDFLMIRET